MPNNFFSSIYDHGYKKNRLDPENAETDKDSVAIPYVYALLSSKEERQYAAVLNAVIAEEYRIENWAPKKIMCDFEMSIINASLAVFPDVPCSCCFFHLGKCVYRHIQNDGLQIAYNDPFDRDIKKYTHMMLGLAYVPIEEV